MAHEEDPHSQSKWLGIDWLYSTYMWVWVGLLVLTIIEVLVPEPQLIGLAQFPRTVTVLSLIVLALAKTVMVAWYYMHLIDERPSIILVACAPFIFSVFLTIGLWPHLPANSAIEKEPTDEPVDKTGQLAPGGEDVEHARAPSDGLTDGLTDGMQVAETSLDTRR